MEKYQEIYSFNVFDEIKKGNKVYALDRKLAEVFVINTMEVEDFATCLHRAKAEKNRYMFWIINEEEELDA